MNTDPDPAPDQQALDVDFDPEKNDAGPTGSGFHFCTFVFLSLL